MVGGLKLRAHGFEGCWPLVSWACRNGKNGNYHIRIYFYGLHRGYIGIIEKKMEISIMGYIGTTIVIHSFITPQDSVTQLRQLN